MRIQGLAQEKTPFWLRPFLHHQVRKYGRVLDASRLWARSPRLFLAVAALYGTIDRRASPVPAALRSLITVRVSLINHCWFCVDVNTRTLMQRGVSEDKVLALTSWRISPLFDARERAALDYAEAMTFSDRSVEDRHVEALRPFLDDDGIVELTALVAFQNLSSKFNAALGVPPQGFCGLPGLPSAPREPADRAGPGPGEKTCDAVSRSGSAGP